MTQLRDELEDLHDRAPHQVRLVLDHDRTWERIMAQVALVEAWKTFSEVSPHHERQLRDLAEGIRRAPSLVPDWQGPARMAFESTVETMARRIESLAELGADHQALGTVSDGVRRQTESVIRDLVGSAVSHLTRTLIQSIQLAIITSGESLRAWTVSAIVLSRHTRRLVESCVARATALLDRIAELSEVVDQDTRRVQDSLDEMTRRLG